MSWCVHPFLLFSIGTFETNVALIFCQLHFVTLSVHMKKNVLNGFLSVGGLWNFLSTLSPCPSIYLNGFLSEGGSLELFELRTSPGSMSVTF